MTSVVYDISNDINEVSSYVKRVITDLEKKTQTREDTEYILSIVIPKLIAKWINPSYPLSSELVQLHLLFRSIIELTVKYGFKDNIQPLVETFITMIANNYNFNYKLPKEHKIVLEKPIHNISKESVSNSELIEDYVNYFASIDGFNLLFKHLRNENENPCTLPFMHTLITTIYTIRGNYLFSDEFIQSITTNLQDVVSKRLSQLTETDLRSPKDDFNKTINNILSLMEKIIPQSNARNFILDLALKVSLQCFHSYIFDKRIYGLTFITNLISSIRHGTINHGDLLSYYMISNKELIDEKTLISWLLQNKIIASVFGDSHHTEIIRRSGPLLDILASQDVLAEEDLKLCLGCIVKLHPSVSVKVLELLTTASTSFLPHHIDTILKFFASLQLHTFDTNVVTSIISFLEKLSKASLRNSAQKLESFDLLWKIVEDESQRFEYCGQALQSLISLVNLHDFTNYRTLWIDRLISSIKKKSLSQSFYYQILAHILVTFSSSRKIQQMQSTLQHHFPLDRPVVNNLEEASTIEQIVMYFQTSNQILDFLFEEYVNFVNNARLIYLTAQNIKESDIHMNSLPDLDYNYLGGRLCYLDEIRHRLDLIDLFLKHVSSSSTLLLNGMEGWNKSFLALWKRSVVLPLTQGERSLCLQWFINLRDVNRYYGNPNYLAISNEASLFLFNHMRSLDPLHLDPIAYQCFQLYFCDVNVNEGNMTWIKQSPGNPNSTFQVRKVNNLVGYDAIWNIVLNAVNAQVVDSSMKFLNHLHENIEPNMTEIKGTLTLRQEFIEICLRKLQESHKVQIEATEKGSIQDIVTSKRCIERCLQLLMQYLSIDTTVAVTKCRKPVTVIAINNITKADILGTAQFHIGNTIEFTYDNDNLNKTQINLPPPLGPKEFVFTTHTGVTLSQVRKIIWERFTSTDEFKATRKTIHENKIILRIQDDNLVDSKEILNQTLFQLNFRSRQAIRVFVQPSIEGRETVFRTRQKWTSVLASQVNQSNRSSHTIRPPNADEKASKIMSCFPISKEVALYALSCKDWDLDHTAMMLAERLNEVLAEAQNAGISNLNNEKTIQEGDKTSPGWLLANTTSFFENLFSLLQVKDATIKWRVWDLLQYIPPAVHLTNALFALQGKPNWATYFGDQFDSFKLLYLLQVIDNRIFPTNIHPSLDFSIQWLEYFYRTNGLQQLLTTYHLLIQRLHSTTDIPMDSEQVVECLAHLLKLIGFYASTSSIFEDSLSVTDSQIISPVKAALYPTEQSQGDPISRWLLLDDSVTTQLLSTLMLTLQWITKLSESNGAIFNEYWVSAVVCYAFKLLKTLCRESQKVTDNLIKNVQTQFYEIVQKLIISPILSVRDETATGIYYLASISKTLLTGSILDALLTIESRIHVNTDRHISTKCREFYNLLSTLILELGNSRDGQLATKLEKQALPLWQDITKRSTYETEILGEADEVLCGKMSVLASLLESNPNFIQTFPKDILEGGIMINTLVNDFLFVIKIEEIVSSTKRTSPKCNTQASRRAALRLLTVLCRYSRINYYCLIQNLKSMMLSGKLKNITSWDYHPSSNDKAPCKFVGITNLGSTCYMNALLQQFYHIPTLRHGILEAEVKDSMEPNLLFELQRLFAFLQLSELKTYDPSLFCSVCRVDGRPINVKIQHDVDEFMNVLCSEIENQLKGSCHERLLQRHFGVVLSNEITSLENDYPYFSETQESFLKIPLEVKNNQNLHQALDVLVTCDKLDGENAYNCEKYSRKITATKRYCIKSLSNMLIFNLKRFEFDYTLELKKKVYEYFSFPKNLNMKRWTQEGLRSVNDSDTKTPSRPDSYYEYELVGVLVHTGNAESGHYYSYIRHKDDDGVAQWYEFNDSRVSHFDISRLESECYGGYKDTNSWDSPLRCYVKKVKVIEKSAYMLFYQRIHPENISYWGSTSDDDPKDLSEEEKLNRIKAREGAVLQAQRLAHDKSRLVRGVPIKLYNMVLRENAEFLRDRQFFESCFSDFLLNFATTFCVNPENELETKFTMAHIKVICRYIVESLVHAADKSTLPRWVPILRQIFRHNHNAARIFLVYVLRARPEEKSRIIWDNDCNVMKHILLDSPQETTRIFFSDLISAALLALAPIEYASSLWEKTKSLLHTDSDKLEDELDGYCVCCQVVLSLFSMIDVSRTVWKQFKQYFEVIRNFAMISWYTREFLRSLHVIKDLFDYFMNNSGRSKIGRPQIMDNEHFPDLHEFHDVLEVIIRGARNERNPPEGVEVDDEYFRTSMSIAGKINTGLNESEKVYFFESLFNSMMEMDYNGPSMARVIQHVCWECDSRTQLVIYFLLYQVSNERQIPNKVRIFSSLLEPLFSMGDSLKNKRINWILSPFQVSFPHPSKSQLGLFGIMRHGIHDLIILRLIIYLALHTMNEDNGPEGDQKNVYSYLLNRRSELYWMKEFLITKLDSTNEPKPTDITVEEVTAAEEIIRNNPPGTQSNVVTNKHLYLVVTKLISQSSTSAVPADWKQQEAEFLAKIESIQDDIHKAQSDNESLKKKLQNLQQFYRSKCPDVIPPEGLSDDEHNSGWKMGTATNIHLHGAAAPHGMGLGSQRGIRTQEQPIYDASNSPPPRPTQPLPSEFVQSAGSSNGTVIGAPTNTQEPDNPPVYGPQPKPTAQGSSPPNVPDYPPEADELVDRLREIFANYSREVLKIALRNCNWDLQRAVEEVFDETKLQQCIREAEGEKNDTKNIQFSQPEVGPGQVAHPG